MRISMVIGTLERGGAEHQMVGLSEQLAARGHEVEVITLHGTGPLAGRLEATGVPVLCLAPPERVRRIRKVHAAIDLATLGARLQKHWRSWKPRVVHAWLPEAQIIALPVAKRARVPVRVMGLRSMRSGARGGATFDRLLAVAARCATAITANSRAVAEDPGWPQVSSRVKVIANGLELPSEHADATREPARGVVVANLISYKGHRDLLAALQMCSLRPHVTFVGAGPERASLEAEIGRSNLRNQVTLLGSIEAPLEVLLECQFAISPSHTEGMPNAILESMAAGLPVVATDAGGTRELVKNGVNGLLVPVGDVKRLSEAIDSFAGDPIMRQAMGHQGRHIAASHDWGLVVDQYLDLYHNHPV